MAMKSPVHPGRIVKRELDELQLTIAEVAKGLGVTRQQLYKIINGESAVTPEMAVRLEKAIGSSADTWLRMQGAYDLAQVRRREIIVQRLAPKGAFEAADLSQASSATRE